MEAHKDAPARELVLALLCMAYPAAVKGESDDGKQPDA